LQRAKELQADPEARKRVQQRIAALVQLPEGDLIEIEHWQLTLTKIVLDYVDDQDAA
jgi:hypothetical protein